jgi:hypothetical protein
MARRGTTLNVGAKRRPMIGSHLCVEAETLVELHLRQAGFLTYEPRHLPEDTEVVGDDEHAPELQHLLVVFPREA